MLRRLVPWLAGSWGFLRGFFENKRAPKNRVVIQPHTMVVFGRYAVWWSTAKRGDEPGMQIVGDFYISNNSTSSG